MGSLRAIFALSVVLAHSWLGRPIFVGGQLAVQLFYIVSGFLISYVLVENRRYATLRDFYVNRYLRLFPIYAAVAVLTLILFLATQESAFFEVYRAAPLAAALLLVFSNAFLFGQDWIMFSGVDHGALVFTENFLASSVVLYKGLLLPQAWTLGVELTFYLVAPFILRFKRTLFAVLIFSVVLRIYLIKIGIGTKDPWTYRFFPTELALFLLGSLSHQLVLPWYREKLGNHLLVFGKAATFFLIGCSLLYFLIPVKEVFKAVTFIAVFLLLVPFAFVFQGRNKLDNWIGNLSYPIYIGHMLVIYIVTIASKKLEWENKYYFLAACVFLTVGFAVALNYWVGEPFERVRDKFRLKSGPNLKVSVLPH